MTKIIKIYKKKTKHTLFIHPFDGEGLFSGELTDLSDLAAEWVVVNVALKKVYQHITGWFGSGFGGWSGWSGGWSEKDGWFLWLEWGGFDGKDGWFGWIEPGYFW